MVVESNLDILLERFNDRYVFKKKINAIICFVIAFCGISAVLYSIFIFHNNLFDRLRYMTFWGTIFTSIISLIFGFICIDEERKQTEMTYKWTYYLRLSSATTEVVIFIIVLFGLTPLVPDSPDISSYPGIMMHIVIPLLTIFSFVFNDPPIGKLKPYEPFYGTVFISIYVILMSILFGLGILPYGKAPYSFLDFKHTSTAYRIACLIGVYMIGYSVSKLLSELNMKMSWIWFSDLKKRHHT